MRNYLYAKLEICIDVSERAPKTQRKPICIGAAGTVFFLAKDAPDFHPQVGFRI